MLNSGQDQDDGHQVNHDTTKNVLTGSIRQTPAQAIKPYGEDSKAAPTNSFPQSTILTTSPAKSNAVVSKR